MLPSLPLTVSAHCGNAHAADADHMSDRLTCIRVSAEQVGMHREGILPILRLRTHVPVGLRSAFDLELRLASS